MEFCLAPLDQRPESRSPQSLRNVGHPNTALFQNQENDRAYLFAIAGTARPELLWSARFVRYVIPAFHQPPGRHPSSIFYESRETFNRERVLDSCACMCLHVPACVVYLCLLVPACDARSEPSSASMACVRSGPMSVSSDISTSKEGEELFKEDRRCGNRRRSSLASRAERGINSLR